MDRRPSRRAGKCSTASSPTACWCRPITSPSLHAATWPRPRPVTSSCRSNGSRCDNGRAKRANLKGCPRSEREGSRRLRIGAEEPLSEGACDGVVIVVGVEEVQHRGRPEKLLPLTAELHVHRGVGWNRRLYIRLIIVHATVAPERRGDIEDEKFLHNIPRQAGITAPGSDQGDLFSGELSLAKSCA